MKKYRLKVVQAKSWKANIIIYPVVLWKPHFPGGVIGRIPDFQNKLFNGYSFQDVERKAEEWLVERLTLALNAKEPIPEATDPAEIALHEGDLLRLIAIDLRGLQKERIQATREE